MNAKRRLWNPWVSLLAAGLTSCAVGRTPESLRNLQGPEGANVVVHLRSIRDAARSRVPLAGELIEATDTAFLVLGRRGFVRVPLLPGMRVRVGPYEERIGSSPGRFVERVRLLARHPHGLTGPQLDSLLALREQERLLRLTPTGELEPAATGGTSAGADPTLGSFLDSARAVRQRLGTIEAAVAAGYRSLGPEFPGMGRHWIHPGRVVAGRVVADEPAVLCFARVAGEWQLVGLAYTVPLRPGDPVPDHPGGAHAWHDHAERVDEEVLLLAGPMTARHGSGTGSRLAMIHAWPWLENPDGALAQNNWRLPFHQLGLDAGHVAPGSRAARALSLATAGVGYYLELARRAVTLDGAAEAALREALERQQTRTAAWLARVGDRPLVKADLVSLEEGWDDLWAEVRSGVAPAVWEALAPLRAES